MILQLPPQLAALDPLRHDLERSSVSGGQDNMPYPTEAALERDRLILTRALEESGMILVPWRIEGAGQFMVSSATLMERTAPYPLPVELARGKIHQLRVQCAEWLVGGLCVSPELDGLIRAATKSFAHALVQLPDASAMTQADLTLQQAYQAGHQLVQTYVQQVMQIRHARLAQLETGLGCRLEVGIPADADAPAFLQAFNTVSLPFHWRDVEPASGQFNWDGIDERIAWANSQGLRIVGGPLIDFGGRNFPDWVWQQSQHDLRQMCGLLCDYVESVVLRYQGRIRAWQITAGSNCAGVLARRDDELIWLTLRLAEAARRVDPHLEIIVGLAQPWGDYLTEQERSKTPFIFADDLLRTGIKPSALDIEMVMGISPRGSYCRDLLDATRMLDLYTLLGVPLQITVGYPSSGVALPQACADQRVNLGYWRTGYTDETQQDWAAAFTALALCKPSVRTVQWCHWSDAEPHQFPNCGLVEAAGHVKPALQELARLRAEHLT
jgi:hypothetical protein